MRTYSELSLLDTFEDRFRYLLLSGSVGAETFGFDRYINQSFYRSREWRSVRDLVIIRDGGCDLGIPGFEIRDRILIHHMNPMRVEDLLHGGEEVLDPAFLITTTHKTHNAIHYGYENNLPRTVVFERSPGDTQLW